MEVYFGHDGVQLAAPSNKAARLIQGKTVDNLVGLKANDSLKTYDLNLSKHKDRRKLDATVGRAGGLVLDEFSQLQSLLFHAAALRTSAARMDRYHLNISDYARPSDQASSLARFRFCSCAGTIYSCHLCPNPLHFCPPQKAAPVSTKLLFPCLPTFLKFSCYTQRCASRIHC